MNPASGLSARTDIVPGRVSVIVPTRNSERTIEACLVSVTQQAYPDVETIVVDNFSTDGTALISGRHADLVILSGPERSAQRNRGFEASTGEFVVFLDSDQVLSSQVISEAAAEFGRSQRVGSIVIPESSFGEGFFAKCRTLEKRLNEGHPAVEASRVFRREACAAVSGFDESLTALEDWDFADRVAATGWQTSRTSSSVRHDEGRVVLSEVHSKKRYYAQWLNRYVDDTSSPTRSFSRLHWVTRPTLLLENPLTSLGLVVLKAVEAFAFWQGLRESRRAP